MGNMKYVAIHIFSLYIFLYYEEYFIYMFLIFILKCCWRVGEMHTASTEGQYRGANGTANGRDKVAILDAGSQYGKVHLVSLHYIIEKDLKMLKYLST